MDYDQKELEIAQKYMRGELTDVQFNYLLVQNKIDEEKIQDLISHLSYFEPIATISIVFLVFIISHFVFCLFLCLFQFFLY
jgi:hypothetical protein